MSNNRAFIIALGMTGGSIFILAEAWYGTAGNIWLSAGVLLAHYPCTFPGSIVNWEQS